MLCHPSLSERQTAVTRRQATRLNEVQTARAEAVMQPAHQDLILQAATACGDRAAVRRDRAQPVRERGDQRRMEQRGAALGVCFVG